MADDYEDPTPTQDELNAINRRVHGLDEPKAKKAKAADKAEAADDAKAEAKDVKAADKPAPYQTRQAKAD